MAWVAGLFVVLLVVGLVVLFTAAAFAIRRDFKERFERISSRLGEDAERILRNYAGRH